MMVQHGAAPSLHGAAAMTVAAPAADSRSTCMPRKSGLNTGAWAVVQVDDCMNGGAPKAEAAAAALRRVAPTLDVQALQLTIPMPGHPPTSDEVEDLLSVRPGDQPWQLRTVAHASLPTHVWSRPRHPARGLSGSKRPCGAVQHQRVWRVCAIAIRT